LNKVCTITPAIGGKIKVEASRIKVILTPTTPISIGRRVIAHKLQAVIKETIVGKTPVRPAPNDTACQTTDENAF
jgi:hypothetical protein